MMPCSSTVEQAPYKRPIWVQLSAGQPLTFYFISVII